MKSPEPYMIVDVHTHIFPPEMKSQKTSFFSASTIFAWSDSYRSLKAGLAEELIEMMDDQGVERSVVFGFPWRKARTIESHNDYIIESVKRFPDRLIGFCCFAMEFEDAAAETHRCLDAGLSGVGELASYTSRIDQIVINHLTPVMKICRERKLPLLLHANEPVGHSYPGKAPDSLSGVYRFISSFPDNIVVLAHWGGGLFFYSLMKKEVTEALENVYFDTAASPFLYKNDVYRVAKELVGIEKILFGSDFPLIKPGRYFRELAQSGLSDKEIVSIKGGNAAKLLGLK